MLTDNGEPSIKGGGRSYCSKEEGKKSTYTKIEKKRNVYISGYPAGGAGERPIFYIAEQNEIDRHINLMRGP